MSDLGACSRPQSQSFGGTGPFLEIAPPLSVPLRHFASAAAAFWIFAAAFAWGHGRLLGFDFQARWVLGLVHVLTLGWVTMTILGALSQMLPVHGQVPLQAPWAVRAGWWLLVIGIGGFVSHLWAGLDNYWFPAAFIIGALALYLFSFSRTLFSTKTIDWTGWHFVLALGYLAVLATVGLLLAYDRQRGVIFRDPEGALIAHVHLALIGWVSLAIFGASYRLVSTFTMARMESKIGGRTALILVNIGLIGLALDGLFCGRKLLGLWAVLLAIGYLCYSWQSRAILEWKRWFSEPSLGFTLLALLGGLAWTALGLALAFGWIEDRTEIRAAYVFTALVGWVTPFILGQIHKIVPFLIWLHVYSPRNWRPPVRVPKIEDLTSRRLAGVELTALALSVVFGTAGFLRESDTLLGISSWSLLTTATAYVANITLTLHHLWRPDSRWDR